MLAIKDLNNIIWFGKPVPVILNRTASLGYMCSKGDNPIFRSQNFQMFMIVIYGDLSSKVKPVNRNHIYMFQRWTKSLKTTQKTV